MDGHLDPESTLGRVVSQEVSEGLGRCEVIDGDNLNIHPLVKDGPDEVAPNPAESIDSHSYRHDVNSPCS